MPFRVAIVEPLFPADDVRSPVVLTYVPGTPAVTSSTSVQRVSASTLPPVYLIVLVVLPKGPTSSSMVSVPAVQSVGSFALKKTVTRSGNVSVKASAVAAVPLELLSIVKVSLLVSDGVMEAGEKVLRNWGGMSGATVMVMEAVAKTSARSTSFTVAVI